MPVIVGTLLSGIVLVLAIIGVVIFIRSGSPTPVPAGRPTLTPLVPTPQPTAPPLSPSPTAPKPTAAIVRYRVQPGDTLSEIAQKYQVSMRDIMAANNMRNDVVRSGEELIIPLPTPRP